MLNLPPPPFSVSSSPERSEDIYEFPDSRFVEVLARCCRVWVDSCTLDPDAVRLAEVIIQVSRTRRLPF